jgi:hypothetical protein
MRITSLPMSGVETLLAQRLRPPATRVAGRKFQARCVQPGGRHGRVPRPQSAAVRASTRRDAAFACPERPERVSDVPTQVRTGNCLGWIRSSKKDLFEISTLTPRRRPVGSRTYRLGSTRVSRPRNGKRLRDRFGTGMLECRVAIDRYPDDFPAQFGDLYRRVVGRLADPWYREFLALEPADQARMLEIARDRTV